MTLAVNEAATVDCSGGQLLDLQASGAHYLVVPQYAASHVDDRPVAFTLDAQATGAAGTAAASPPASGALEESTWGASASGGASSRTLTLGVAGAREPLGSRQARFDLALRERAREAISSGEWSRPAMRAAGSEALSTVPPAGSVRTFEVVSTFDVNHATYTAVGATLAYIGANVLVYIDTLAPIGGFTPDQLTAFSQLFDQTLYQIATNAFGAPSDIDGNGRVVMLLTPVVNQLVTEADCNTGGYVVGFFNGFDLVSTSAKSNRGEVFYAVVPDPAGNVSCAHRVADLLDLVPATFLHELQHLISFSQHVIVNRGKGEEGWLDEGLSIVAEELGSLYYEQKFPPPTGRSTPTQLFPDSSQGFIRGALGDSYTYLMRTDTASATLHSDADGGAAWRASDWLLLRWLGDQKGAGFYRQLEHGRATGTANIEAVTGEPFASLFGDFSLSLWTDSIVGEPKSAIPSRDRFVTRTLRILYQAYFNAGGGPRPYPVELGTVGIGATARGSMVPGTMMFYRLDAPAAPGTVRLRFAPPSGSFATNLHPQLSIFRLPE